MLLAAVGVGALLSLVLPQNGANFRPARPMRTGNVVAVTMPPPEGFVWADDDSSPQAPEGAPCAAVKPSKLTVLFDADAVSAHVLARVEAAATKAIAERGHFALAIPGGSILKMLAGSKPEWAAKTTLAYVNHKAVPMEDASLATHAKASALFLDGWEGVNPILMGGSADAAAEAEAYEMALRALPESVLPVSASGVAQFDMALIGVGDDGHVGSLYPGRDEVLDVSGRWVLPVDMKVPGSITLSLPVMANAKEVLIAACGVSDKYPQGKSVAMARGIEGDESPSTFPAVGLRDVADWVLDAAAASTLSSDYAESFALQMSRGDCNPPA